MKSLVKHLKGINCEFIFNSDKTPIKAAMFLMSIVLLSSTAFSQSKSIIIRTYGVPLSKEKSISNNSNSQQNLDTTKMERNLFDLVNQKRRQSGLSSLIWSEEAAKVARLHSRNMLNYNFFGHYGKNNTSVVDRARSLGISNWRAIGENLAFTQGIDNAVEFSMKQWTSSGQHRKNYLDKRWETAAIGISKGQNDTFYFTQVFLDY
jgi:uncharacterized protein YkwD